MSIHDYDDKVLTGVKALLNKLNSEDLHGLMTTVTQGLLKEKKLRRHEVIEVIIKYSPDVQSILKRRVISKDTIFAYIHDNNVKVDLPTTKEKLIDKLHEIWNIPKHKENVKKEEPDTSQRTNVHAISSDEDNVNIMAQQFSQWFYAIMNRGENIEPNHFYPDARFKLNLFENGALTIMEETETPESIAELLFHVKTEHNLFFNPNLNFEGVQGRIDPHGLVLVMVCGTLHSNDICVGVFEQIFALARDPYCDNNWKIKTSELNLRSKSGNIETPNLSNNDLTSKLLLLPN